MDRAMRDISSNVDKDITYLPAKNQKEKQQQKEENKIKRAWNSMEDLSFSKTKEASRDCSPNPDVGEGISDSWWWTSRRYPFNRTMADLKDDLSRDKNISQL